MLMEWWGDAMCPFAGVAFGGAFPCAQTNMIGKGPWEQLHSQSDPEETSAINMYHVGLARI